MESADTVYAQSDLNIEEIMKLEPDVILYNAGNTAHAEILQESGIPCIGFATVGHETEADPLNRYKQWLDLLEDVFGEQGRTDAFTAAGDEIIADVEARIATVPEDERPSALILWKYSDGVPQVSGNGTFGTYWMKHLGVTDVAAETTGFTQVSMEQIYEWNPDILFVDGPGLIGLTSEDVLENKVEGTDFSSIKAVQNGRVYDTTLGMWNWFTPNPDAPLVFAWLACNTDIDKLYEKLDALEDGDILVMAGSIPDVMPQTIYMDIMKYLADKDLKIVVDATKDLLVNVLQYHPFLIKPNNHELGEIFGVKITEKEDVITYAKKMQEKGAGNVLVSMAGDGAVLVAEDGSIFQAEAPKGKVVNSVGAGDSMVAGFVTGYLKTGSYKEAFQMGVCTGSASAFSEELATEPEVLALLDKNKGIFK